MEAWRLGQESEWTDIKTIDGILEYLAVVLPGRT